MNNGMARKPARGRRHYERVAMQGQRAERINHQGQRRSRPRKQAVDMTAPEMFAEPKSDP